MANPSGIVFRGAWIVIVGVIVLNLAVIGGVGFFVWKLVEMATGHNH